MEARNELISRMASRDVDDFESPKKSIASMLGAGNLHAAIPYQGQADERASIDSDAFGSSSQHRSKSLQGSQGFLDEDDEEQIKDRNNRLHATLQSKDKIKANTSRLGQNILSAIGLGKTTDLAGERTIYINDQAMNTQFRFCNNYVSTGKYNLITFVPKFLAGMYCSPRLFHRSLAFLEQFSKYANVFFLFTAAIMQIPGVSPTNRYTTVLPLSLVLLVAAFKEMQEDFKRHQSDRELNARKAKVLNGQQFLDKPWRYIKVGDIIRLESNDFFPADLVLLSSSEPEGLCFIETSNLDGETNLKIKQAKPATADFTSSQKASTLSGYLRTEQPNNSLYTFEGTLVLGSNEVPLDPTQMLLRGAQLRNTEWMYGLVVFTGHETKLMRNAT